MEVSKQINPFFFERRSQLWQPKQLSSTSITIRNSSATAPLPSSHCKRIAPSFDKVAADYEGKLIVGKVDTDEDPAIAQKYDIEYLPTFVLLDGEGNVVDKVVAPASKAAIDEFIHNGLGL